MNSRQRRKLAAKQFNDARDKRIADQLAYEKDKAENPEKYKRKRRVGLSGMMPYIALCAAAGFKI